MNGEQINAVMEIPQLEWSHNIFMYAHGERRYVAHAMTPMPIKNLWRSKECIDRTRVEAVKAKLRKANTPRNPFKYSMYIDDIVIECARLELSAIHQTIHSKHFTMSAPFILGCGYEPDRYSFTITVSMD